MNDVRVVVGLLLVLSGLGFSVHGLASWRDPMPCWRSMAIGNLLVVFGFLVMP